MRCGRCGAAIAGRRAMSEIAFDAQYLSAVRAERRRYLLGRVGVYGFLCLFAAIYLLPLFVIVANSFRSLPALTQNGLMLFPTSFTLDAWSTAWSTFSVDG